MNESQDNSSYYNESKMGIRKRSSVQENYKNEVPIEEKQRMFKS
jgi:hypothetical protein